MNTEQLRQWIKTYGAKNVVLRALLTKLPVIPMSNDELLRRMNWQMRARKRLRKYITITEADQQLEFRNHFKNCIWFMWFQGIDNAPPIVRKCYESIQMNMKDTEYKVVALDENNMFDYVHLPETIIEKWKNGIIGNANFSDLCRIALLCEYGGLWLDATTLLTGPIDKEILDADFFFLQASFLDFTATRVSNWLISSNTAGNGFLLSVRDTLLAYWEQNDIVDDYFIFHLVVAELSERDGLKDQFEKMPFFSNTYPLLLGRELNNRYDEELFGHILKCSNIHKLTYKGLDEQACDSVYKHLLNMEFANESENSRRPGDL